MYHPFFGCPGEGKYSKPSIFRQRLAILREDVYAKQVRAFESRAISLASEKPSHPLILSYLATPTASPPVWTCGPREGDVVLFDELDTIARKYGLI